MKLVYRQWNFKGLEGIKEAVGFLGKGRKHSNRSPMGHRNGIRPLAAEQPGVDGRSVVLDIARENPVSSTYNLLNRAMLLRNEYSHLVAGRRQLDQLRTA